MANPANWPISEKKPPLVQPSISAHRIFSFNFKLLFQWKDTENGRQLMKHMKVMEDFNKQSSRLAGGDPMGKYF